MDQGSLLENEDKQSWHSACNCRSDLFYNLTKYHKLSQTGTELKSRNELNKSIREDNLKNEEEQSFHSCM